MYIRLRESCPNVAVYESVQDKLAAAFPKYFKHEETRIPGPL